MEKSFNFNLLRGKNSCLGLSPSPKRPRRSRSRAKSRGVWIASERRQRRPARPTVGFGSTTRW